MDNPKKQLSIAELKEWALIHSQAPQVKEKIARLESELSSLNHELEGLRKRAIELADKVWVEVKG